MTTTTTICPLSNFKRTAIKLLYRIVYVSNTLIARQMTVITRTDGEKSARRSYRIEILRRLQQWFKAAEAEQSICTENTVRPRDS